MLIAALALTGTLASVGFAQSPGSPAADAAWYPYWIDRGAAGTGSATDSGYESAGSYVTVWSKLSNPVLKTEVQIKELYDTASGGVATILLNEWSPNRELVRRVATRHPEAKLTLVTDPASREYALLALIRTDGGGAKSKEEAAAAFAEAAKRLAPAAGPGR